MQQVTATNGTTDTGLVLPMLARAGSGRDTMENAFMKGIGKAIMASVITIITGSEAVAAITIMMTADSLEAWR